MNVAAFFRSLAVLHLALSAMGFLGFFAMLRAALNVSLENIVFIVVGLGLALLVPVGLAFPALAHWRKRTPATAVHVAKNTAVLLWVAGVSVVKRSGLLGSDAPMSAVGVCAPLVTAYAVYRWVLKPLAGRLPAVVEPIRITTN